ncbi:MAG TPA: PQQ-dependent sugar dehydrogenase [Anaerolineae bacterium]|nr:PQQ-dependent sugar dehydrogenase [Anaerolineae bacterium]
MRKPLLIGCTTFIIALAGFIIYLYFTLAPQVNLVGWTSDGTLANVTIPDGFTINVFAQDLNGPRFLTVGPDNTIYVADRRADRIVALPDADGDGVADSQRIFATDVRRPHSILFHEGHAYVGITSGVIRLTDTDGDGVADERQTIIDDYPTVGAHGTRTLLFLPDGRLLVSIGSSCNVCIEDDPRRGGIVIYDADLNPASERIFATGLRNAVGLALQPNTDLVWATNNGRDLMGDDLPPETISIVTDGADYGWPRCHNGHIPDPEYGTDPDACAGVTPPVVEMQAHTAPLGLTFYPTDVTNLTNPFPTEYHGDLFVALHGSWNRSVPVGYSIVRLDMDGDQPATDTVTDFATGWLRFDDNNESIVDGRPVGLTVGPDGALYTTDDLGGFIYRIAPE